MSTPLLVAWDSVFSNLACAPSGSSPDDSGSGRRRRSHEEVSNSHENAQASSNRLEVIDGIPVFTLLAQLREGDQAALGAFYLALHDPLWRLGVILSGSPDAAEEMVQDVFLAVWLRREAFKPDADIRAYLYTALRNEVKMRGRHARVVRGVESAVAHDALELPAHGRPAVSPDQDAEGREFYAAYQRALATLTERERIALQLRIEEEFTLEQIGQVIGLSKVGARTVVLRAESKLRALLAEYRT